MNTRMSPRAIGISKPFMERGFSSTGLICSRCTRRAVCSSRLRTEQRAQRPVPGQLLSPGAGSGAASAGRAVSTPADPRESQPARMNPAAMRASQLLLLSVILSEVKDLLLLSVSEAKDLLLLSVILSEAKDLLLPPTQN